MGLKDLIKKNIDNLRADELVIISEQIRLLRKARPSYVKVRPLKEIRKMTATSKSNWADDVIKERHERG